MSLNDPPRRLGLGKRLVFGCFVAAFVYAVAEAALSLVASRVVPSVYWVFEETGPSVRFDPVSGYRVHGGPARVAKFVRSKNPFAATLEYVGGFVGNEQGFPDRDPFRTARADPEATRLAVLGDSFSGGDLLLHWPDACEDAVALRGGRAELLNFSLTGIGLANWHSILTREIEPAGYGLDGVVFAVWENDLGRRFYVCDHGGSETHLGGRVPSWDPAAYPRTSDEARQLMRSWQGYIVPRTDFEGALRGRWRPSRPVEPLLAGFVEDLVRDDVDDDTGPAGAPAPGGLAADLRDTTHGRGRLVREIREALARMGVPALVVSIPTIEELMEGRSAPAGDDARAFADYLGARFVDGADAYDGLEGMDLRSNWYPVDLHWNQTGSDRFARWMADEVLRWPVRGGEVRADVPDARTGAVAPGDAGAPVPVLRVDATQMPPLATISHPTQDGPR
jgi:hypothetical protein